MTTQSRDNSFGFKAKRLEFNLDKRHNLQSISIELYHIKRYNSLNMSKMCEQKNIETMSNSILQLCKREQENLREKIVIYHIIWFFLFYEWL